MRRAYPNNEAAGGGGTRASHEPPAAQGHEAEHAETAHRGADAPDGTHSSTEQPRPRARAAEAHEPEPPPDHEADGATHDGQGCPADGDTTTKPPGATDWTQATERSTSRPANDEAAKAEARNTDAAGNAPRTALSTPAAQPTDTPAAGPTNGNTDEAAATADGQDREPEKATAAKPPTKEKREDMAELRPNRNALQDTTQNAENQHNRTNTPPKLPTKT